MRPQLRMTSSPPDPFNARLLRRDTTMSLPGGRADCDRRRLNGLQSLLAGTGGLVTTEQMLELMRRNCSQPISRLARWIAFHQVVQVPAASCLWLPLFQFSPSLEALQRGLEQVMTELAPMLDDVEIACWFAEPNPTLAGRAPADLLAREPEEVRQAARVERFIRT